MTVIINDGRLILSDGTDKLKLAVVQIKWDKARKPTLRHYPAREGLGYTLRKRWVVVKCKEAILDTYQKYSDFVDYIDEFQDAGPFTLRIERDSVPNYIEFWDGETTINVMLVNERDHEKLSKGDEQVYQIGFLMFEEV